MSTRGDGINYLDILYAIYLKALISRDTLPSDSWVYNPTSSSNWKVTYLTRLTEKIPKSNLKDLIELERFVPVGASSIYCTFASRLRVFQALISQTQALLPSTFTFPKQQPNVPPIY